MKSTIITFMTIAFYLSFSFVALSMPLSQTQNDTPPDSASAAGKPEIFVRWTDKKIVIDGVLDDAAWNDADPYEACFFQHQPLDRAPSSEKTRVMVLQDAKMIYFGIQCYDSEPGKIFASSMRRDTNYGNGDVIELLIDTFHDNRNCYAFDTSPLGGKGDALLGDQGNHINKQWECVMYADGAYNDKGWAAEFAFPFKSLKYREGEVVEWGINISRDIKHRQEETYLVPIPRALGHMGKFRGELWATLRNIRPPKQGFNFAVSPYVLTGQTNVYNDEVQRKKELHGGVDFKYDLTTQLALDLTYKTDFAQAEADEEIVNVTRFNILRQEKREFFLQNAGLFQFGTGQRNQTNFALFDSRTIGIQGGQPIPLLGGGKLTGRAGPYSIAVLSLQSERTQLTAGLDQPSANYTALRLKRDISKNSHIGMMLLNQEVTLADYSRAIGVDGLYNMTPAIRFDASLARSLSPDVTSKDMAGDFGFLLNKEWIDINLRYTHIDSLFNPKMGFVWRSNIRSTNGSVTFTKWINARRFQNIAFTSGLSYITDHHQVLQTRNNDFYVAALLQNGDQISIGATRAYEFVPLQTFIRDIKINPGFYNTWSQSVSVNTFRARPVYAFSTWQWGEMFDGTFQSADIQGSAKLSNHMTVDLAYSYDQIKFETGGLVSHVVSTRWTYSFTPDLFTKAYVQWNKADEHFSANFLIDYAYKPRSHIYLVYNEDQDTWRHKPKDRIIMLKMNYFWQI